MKSDICVFFFDWRENPQNQRKNLNTKYFSGLFSRIRSRSLSELTRQITPPTKNSHAPPFIESRKSSQSVNPYNVWTWWVFPCWVKLSRRLHSWWCPSVNSFKFQPCNHTPPRTQTLWFPIGRCWWSHWFFQFWFLFNRNHQSTTHNSQRIVWKKERKKWTKIVGKNEKHHQSLVGMVYG